MIHSAFWKWKTWKRNGSWHRKWRSGARDNSRVSRRLFVRSPIISYLIYFVFTNTIELWVTQAISLNPCGFCCMVRVLTLSQNTSTPANSADYVTNAGVFLLFLVLFHSGSLFILPMYLDKNFFLMIFCYKSIHLCKCCSWPLKQLRSHLTYTHSSHFLMYLARYLLSLGQTFCFK